MYRNYGELISGTLKAISTAVFLTALGACSSHVTVHDLSIPDPLVEKIPVSIAVKFPDVFEHFVHEEQVIDKKKWTIDLGRSHVFLFTDLFRAMYDDLTVINDDVDARDTPIDFLIEPSIDAFEFSVPAQSHTSSFAVWIRYRIKIFDDEGKLLASWPINAYGKSLSTVMGGNDALHRAAVLAMRDAAALIIMRMDEFTGISSTSRETLSSVAARPGPKPPDTVVEEMQVSASEDTTDETG